MPLTFVLKSFLHTSALYRQWFAKHLYAASEGFFRPCYTPKNNTLPSYPPHPIINLATVYRETNDNWRADVAYAQKNNALMKLIKALSVPY